MKITPYNALAVSSRIQACLDAYAGAGRGFNRAFKRMVEFFMWKNEQIYFAITTHEPDALVRLHEKLKTTENMEYALAAWLMEIEQWVAEHYPDLKKRVCFYFITERSPFSPDFMSLPWIQIDMLKMPADRDFQWQITKLMDDLVWAFRGAVGADSYYLADEKHPEVLEFLKTHS